jgi:glycosyltransferase involved in cell wall biosynthesis
LKTEEFLGMYNYIIVTHIPAFYKVNLYNELAKDLKIFVIFIASNTNEKRADDFITLEKATFEYQVLFDGNFQDRSSLKNIAQLRDILKTKSFKKLLVSGWDLKEFWYLVLTNPKSKNCLALESTINESRVDGIRGFIKKIFLSRISTVFASGKLHEELLTALGYKGEIKITKGVGIINKPTFEIQKKEYKKRFLYIGRLSPEKNLKMLIEIFNTLPTCTLTLIGTGPQEIELKNIANENIIFVGQVENSNLQKYFIDNDIFILPSIAEPWGLVVEEALYFGLPVMVSRNCGASELIDNGKNGYILDVKDIKSIEKNIKTIDDEKYQRLLDGVRKYSIDVKDREQVETYEN